MNARLLLGVFLALAVCTPPGLVFAQAPPPARPTARSPASAKVDAAKLYAEQCAVCHGKKGEGTPMGRPLAAPLMHGETIEAIAEILTTGIEGTPMISFSKKLTAAQIQALATYVSAMKR